eukprot:GEMP01058232.1.p1 GENE.GEMP01058232.1~~GEMP01058232.1.p1  ORF type:complete len:281 (+),score=50.40 GEMP01058232.1:102-944(+)
MADVSPWHATLGPRKKAIFLAPALAHITPIKTYSAPTQSSPVIAPSVLPPPVQQPVQPPAPGSAFDAPAPLPSALPRPIAPSRPRPIAPIAPIAPNRQSNWSGALHMTRSNNKRVTFTATLAHGDLLGVEIVLKSMANDPHGVLNISHRIPFEEIAKPERTIMSVLGLAAITRGEYDVLMVNDYCTYFRQKMRAGSVKLDENHSMYVVPPLDMPLAVGPNAHLYALSPNIMPNALLAVVCKVHAPAPRAGEKRKEPDVTPDMIVDLFTNPELIALLNATK